MWPKWLTAEFWKGIWDDFVEFMSDLPIKVLKGFLDGVLEVLKAVQPPGSWRNIGYLMLWVVPVLILGISSIIRR